MQKYKYICICLIAWLVVFASCQKKPYFALDNSLKVSFSTDTITFDTVFTSIGSSTRHLMVYNNNEENIKISSLRLQGGNQSQFSINVDGESGYEFSDIEVYSKDSIYIFIRVTINPDNQNNPFFVEDKLVFETNNNKQTVSLTAYGQNAIYIIADQEINGFPKFKIVADSLQETRWTAEKPYVIYGYALINSYGTLVIEEGARIHFHDKSGLWAYSEGQLRVEGTKENPVVFQGDRLEDYYDNQPGQWDRIWLMEAREDHGHRIENAIIKNGFIGIQAERFLKDNMAPMYIYNTVIDNQTGMGLYANLYNIKAGNFLVSNCGTHALALTGGGEYIFEQATIANYWSQSARTNPSVIFNNIYYNPADQMSYAYNFYFEMNNSILYGNQENEFETDFFPGPDTTYIFNNSLLKTIHKNYDPNFVNYNECIFNKDPKFVNKEFDYHIDSLSPAIGLGNPAYSVDLLQYDLDGVSRNNCPDAGVYQFVPISE